MRFNDNDFNQMSKDYNTGGNAGGWYQLEVGDNKVRLVSEYEPLAKHFSGRGQKPITCIGMDKGCIRCGDYVQWEVDHQNDVKKIQNPHKPTLKLLFWVIDRRDGEFKIAEFGWSIGKAIKELGEDSEYAFNKETGLPDYDLNIKKVVTDPSPSGTKYTVIAGRQNTPLTPDELAQIPNLTPIKQVIEAIKAKTIKEYEEMGMSLKPIVRNKPTDPKGAPIVPASPASVEEEEVNISDIPF